MPHKHRQHGSKSDPNNSDLPPPSKAVSATSHHRSQANSKKGTSAGRRRKSAADDTPRAFQRLFQTYRPPRSGQDDGSRPSKKSKTSHTPQNENVTVELDIHDRASNGLQILPGEPLSHFSARVDAALPFASLTKAPSKADPSVKGIGKARVTKLEKRMKKMQQAWREEDKRRKENATAPFEEMEGAVDEDGVEDMGLNQTSDGHMPTKKMKARARKENLWGDVENKRKQGNQDGLVGLHNVVQAPPKFTNRKNDRAVEKVKAKHGGLKEEAELTEARRKVIEGYRAMMQQRRDGLDVP